LTTHDMADIAHLCARMMIIDHGHLLYDGSVEAIRDRFGTERTLVVDRETDEPGPLVGLPAEEIRADGLRRWLRFRRAAVTAAELIAAVSDRYPIRELTIEEAEIDDTVPRIHQAGISHQ